MCGTAQTARPISRSLQRPNIPPLGARLVNYRPKYVAVGAFAPGRIARLWQPEEPMQQPAAVSAMENEGGPVASEPAAKKRSGTRKP